MERTAVGVVFWSKDPVPEGRQAADAHERQHWRVSSMTPDELPRLVDSFHCRGAKRQVQLFSWAREWDHIPKPDLKVDKFSEGTFSWCFWKMRMLPAGGKVPRNSRVVCHPFLSHAHANAMQMCRGEVFVEGPRRVFTQGKSLRELDQSKSALVLKVSQKKVLGGEMQACCWRMGTSVFLGLSSWGQQVHFTNYLFLWRQHIN